jgi:nicotinamidase-related amidase
MKTALLVIDVQRALCEGKYEVFGAGEVIRRINLLSAKARKANALVVIIQHESKSTVLAYQSEGWQLAEGLHTEVTDTFLRKTAADSFHKTELESLLRERNVTQLVVCGMQSDFCVDTTTRRALALNFPVTLVSDGHSTLDNEHLAAAQIIAHHNATLANISSFGPIVTLVPAEEVRIEG